MSGDSVFVDVAAGGREFRIEHRWIAAGDAAAPLLVFLHEGLGSVSAWRDYPDRLCAAAGTRGLVYSRPGYGRSTPRAAHEHWAPDFMHIQAHTVLPALLVALDVDVQAHPPWLFGHSDGGSIALLHAAQFPRLVAGLVVVAPHIKVEAFGLASIRQARDAYRNTDLRERLARHHDDPDSAFYGWNGVWLSEAFEAWNIEDELAHITCPLLAVQGVDDPYGTMAQIDGIASRAAQTRLLKLPACGHSPHRDQPEALTRAAAAFIREHRISPHQAPTPRRTS
jgi:pimeloyl-ACP methyl ester carboxylesterase